MKAENVVRSLTTGELGSDRLYSYCDGLYIPSLLSSLIQLCLIDQGFLFLQSEQLLKHWVLGFVVSFIFFSDIVGLSTSRFCSFKKKNSRFCFQIYFIHIISKEKSIYSYYFNQKNYFIHIYLSNLTISTSYIFIINLYDRVLLTILVATRVLSIYDY